MKNIKKILKPFSLIICIILSMLSCEFENIECPAGTGETYKPINRDSLISQVRNYRDNIWKRTSPYYASTMDNLTTGDDDEKVDIRSLHTQNGYAVIENKNNLDARFADFSRAELEDYLCTIRNLPNADSITTVRIYYTRYGDNPSIDPSFANKHSLAIVPVIIDGEHKTIREVLDNGKDIDDPGYKSYIMNHPYVCPPKRGWINSNTILGSVDMPSN